MAARSRCRRSPASRAAAPSERAPAARAIRRRRRGRRSTTPAPRSDLRPCRRRGGRPAAGDRIAAFHRPLDRRDAPVPRQKRGMVADRGFRRLGARLRRDEGVGVGRQHHVDRVRDVGSDDPARATEHDERHAGGAGRGRELVFLLKPDDREVVPFSPRSRNICAPNQRDPISAMRILCPPQPSLCRPRAAGQDPSLRPPRPRAAPERRRPAHVLFAAPPAVALEARRSLAFRDKVCHKPAKPRRT